MDKLVQNVSQNEVNQGPVVAFDEKMILENIGFMWTGKILRENFFLPNNWLSRENSQILTIQLEIIKNHSCKLQSGKSAIGNTWVAKLPI